MVATDLKLIKSLMRRDSFYGGVPNAESARIILNTQSALLARFSVARNESATLEETIIPGLFSVVLAIKLYFMIHSRD